MELKELEDLLKENPDGVDLVCFDETIMVNRVNLVNNTFIGIDHYSDGGDIELEHLIHFKPHDKYKEKAMEFQVGDKVRYKFGTTEVVGILESTKWAEELKIRLNSHHSIDFNLDNGSTVSGAEGKLELIERPKKKEKRRQWWIKYKTNYDLTGGFYKTPEEVSASMDGYVAIRKIEESEREFEVE